MMMAGRLSPGVSSRNLELTIDRVISDKPGNYMSVTFQRVNQGSSVPAAQIYDSSARKYERKDFFSRLGNFVPS